MTEEEARRAIGQLLLANWPKGSAAKVRADLRAYPFGGVVLHTQDVEEPHALRDRNADLWAHAQEEGLPPLWVAVTEEGGTVHRFPKSPRPPSAMALAAADSGRHVESVSAMMGRFLASQGVNWNFAPDLDVLTREANPVIGTRSFGPDARTVADLGSVWIRAHEAQGVIATGKHFPGHGMTELDSHVAHPVADIPREALEPHLEPFRAAIRAGVGAMMTAHVLYPRCDGAIATFSAYWQEQVLRGELGFSGMIVSDALSMRGASGDRSLVEAGVSALHAGVDVLDVGGTWEDACSLLDGLFEAWRKGGLREDRVLESLVRVRSAKRGLRSPDRWPGIPSSEEMHRVFDPVHEGAVTLVQGERPDASPSYVLWVAPLSPPEVEELLADPGGTGRADFASTWLGSRNWSERWPEVEAVPNDRTSLLYTANVWKDTDLTERLRAWAEGRNCVHVALRDPVDLAYVAVRGARIAAFGDEAQALRRVTNWVHGRGAIRVGVAGSHALGRASDPGHA